MVGVWKMGQAQECLAHFLRQSRQIELEICDTIRMIAVALGLPDQESLVAVVGIRIDSVRVRILTGLGPSRIVPVVGTGKRAKSDRGPRRHQECRADDGKCSP